MQGIPVAETMRRYEIDPGILGASREEGFSYTLNKKAIQENGFSDRRSENYRRLPKTGEETVECESGSLERARIHVAGGRIPKKLQAANMEAQKPWESKSRQK